ncbi:Enhancer of polycomb-like protein 1 [Ascosphaera acerosa]|nr:Enhancer of polycomb-like protein 1 [Ascosphaera acerosa]
MTTEDAVALTRLNAGRDAQSRVSEDRFEEVMAFFEETAQLNQPFAVVDHPPVLSYAEMEAAFDNLIDDVNKKAAPHIYEHWKARRSKAGNRPLKATLKSETGRETDDSDPYVCFRRREVRQVRKTRGRDAQMAEKLRRLRGELEDARGLLSLVLQREKSRYDSLVLERQVFRQRCEVKEIKRKLHLRDDDEDLINQKLVSSFVLRTHGRHAVGTAADPDSPQPKKKAPEASVAQKPAAAVQPRPSGRPAMAAEELRTLESVQAERDKAILADISQNVAKHARWNEGYVDWTTMPLTPTPERHVTAEFRPAITTEYLPTPPSSDSSDSGRQAAWTSRHALPSDMRVAAGLLRQPTPPAEDVFKRMPCFRRRIGRGGRMLIDRRNIPFLDRTGVDPARLERYRYDCDDRPAMSATYN